MLESTKLFQVLFANVLPNIQNAMLTRYICLKIEQENLVIRRMFFFDYCSLWSQDGFQNQMLVRKKKGARVRLKHLPCPT